MELEEILLCFYSTEITHTSCWNTYVTNEMRNYLIRSYSQGTVCQTHLIYK